VSQRIEKVQKVAREVLGEAIQSLKDPRIGFATVTAVRVTQDLRYARVLVSVMGSEEEQETTMAGLRSASSHLRLELGKEMRIKYVPELDFVLDTGPATAERVEELIKKIHDEAHERES
jgi:ribosome-binding factor A